MPNNRGRSSTIRQAGLTVGQHLLVRQGLCVRCHEPRGPDGTSRHCPRHAREMVNYIKDWRKRLRSEGKCLNCSQVMPPSRRGKTLCKKCNGKAAFRMRLAKYNITPAVFFQMVEDQDGQCAICAVKLGRNLHIDHCHKSGKVRGLLCSRCNTGLGSFMDSAGRLASARDYLIRAQSSAA